MTTKQPSFLTREMLSAELEAAQASLSRHLDDLVQLTSSTESDAHLVQEHLLMEIRYWATTVRTVSDLLRASPA